MRLRPRFGCKRIFIVFRAQGTCLVVANVVLPVVADNSAPPPNLVAGFEWQLRGGRAKGKGKKRREIKVKKAPKEVKHPGDRFLATVSDTWVNIL